MLPGFRFLLATVVLAGAVLMFALGAAALLRAAHEEFASLPSWRAPPPTLALLRVEAPQGASDAAMKDAAPAARPDDQSAAAESAAGTPEVAEAVKPEEIAAVPAPVSFMAAPDATKQPSDIVAGSVPQADPTPVTVASLPAPTEATAAAQPGKPAATATRQAAARAAARRRLVIARARAAARARALEQQKQKTLDPLAQLFGGS